MRKSQLISINGMEKTLNDWSVVLNIPVSTLRARVKAGWTDDELIKPVVEKKWTEVFMLSELKAWIDNGEWKGPGDLKKRYPSLYIKIAKRMKMNVAFEKLGLNYQDYLTRKNVRPYGHWTKENTLIEFQQYLNEHGWKGVDSFREHDSGLASAVKDNFGVRGAFDALGLDYDRFAILPRPKVVENEENLLQIFHHYIQKHGFSISHLMKHDSWLYRRINRYGFNEAFKKLGLEQEYHKGYLKMTEEETLGSLKELIDKGEWQGCKHLQKCDPHLFESIRGKFGFQEAFAKLGLDYENYKYMERRNSQLIAN